ncbi:MAG: GIY-YIG nuclease family protein, partial [Clostridia bacterium]
IYNFNSYKKVYMNEKVINTLLCHKGILGVKVHKINNGVIRCFEVVSNEIKSIDNLNNINNSGIYFLINNDSKKLYIGQSNNILKRIKDHNKDKEKNFNKFVAFVSDSNDFSRTYIDYLEYYFINESKFDSFNYILENDAKRNIEPIVSEFELPTIEETISNIKALLLNIGIDYINKVNIKSDILNEEINEEIFTYKKVNLIYKDGEFRLLKGSLIPILENKIDNLSKDSKTFDFAKKRYETTNSIIEE